MATEETGYTFGEVRAIIAPLMGMPAEDIDHFVILIRGKCDGCGGRDGYAVTDSLDNHSEFIQLVGEAISTLPHDHWNSK